MKRFVLLTIVTSLLVLAGSVSAFIQEEDGVLIPLEKKNLTDPAQIKIQVCAEDIIRVIATPGKIISSRPSLMIEKSEWSKAKFLITEEGEHLVVTTSKVRVKVHQKTGAVAFYNLKDELLLQEKSEGGKLISRAEVMGEETYHIQQLFESPQDEAFYGLGQHQNGVMNYKGHDVDLWQYNIVAVVPFLVSNKNYGILWDNNSRTKFGDIRDFQSLTNFKMIDAEGNEGGLTAEYYKDSEFTELALSRLESRIEHEFLDVNDPYPDGFRRNMPAIRWKGSIEATESGIHKFRLYCSGYTKMWLNGELIVDNWRQNWLPWTHLPKIKLEKGEKAEIQIDWVHTGGYIGLKCLSPQHEIYDEYVSLWSEVADQIDYYFIAGDTPDQVIQGYRKATGQVPLMPKWALGFWQCRERYQSQEQLLDVVKEFRKRNIPLDNIVQDWFYWPEDKWGSHDFDASRFPDPTAMVNTLHDELNTHIMISVWPKFYVGTKHYDEMNELGFLYKRNIEKKERDWVGPGYVSTFYDPYSQTSRDLFWKQINTKLFSKGIDAWWLDATEPDIHSNLSRPETRLRLGPTALGTFARYLNTYSLMNAKGIYENQRLVNPDQRVFILTRSAFAGQQRYSAVTWSGDIATRWFDLKIQIPSGLNFCLSGIPYWTTDIGGFAVEPRFERNVKPEDMEEWRELNTRWFQYGTFCPIFRVHGQFPCREMFNIAPDDHPAYQTMLAYDKLRYRLMPYIYSVAEDVTHGGYTLMRALVMDFWKDSNVFNIDDQFMFGPSLMINPVTDYKARSREVYLPEGSGWYALKSGIYSKGGQTLEADAPYEDIPIFVKEGSILPFGPALKYTDEKPADPIRLMIYTGKDAEFTLYEDEGVNYNYEDGAFSRISIQYSEDDATLTFEDREGEYPGMLKSRTFEIVWVGKENPVVLALDSQLVESVQYSGIEINIKRNKE